MNSWCWGQNITTPIRSHIRMDQYHQEGCRINITSLHSYQWNLHKPLSWIKDSLWHNLLTTVHTCRLGLSLWRDYEDDSSCIVDTLWSREMMEGKKLIYKGILFDFYFDVCILLYNTATHHTIGNILKPCFYQLIANNCIYSVTDYYSLLCTIADKQLCSSTCHSTPVC